MACLGLFIASFSVGPGVVVWITLSELMPTRIRSTGMGIALLLNQGVSTLIAAVFLPVVGSYGFYAMFTFWAVCTMFYFVTAAFFLPETKGKTLEEIEKPGRICRYSSNLKMRIWTSLLIVRSLNPFACIWRIKSGVTLKMRIWMSSSTFGR
jgi:hypothetical protein